MVDHSGDKLIIWDYLAIIGYFILNLIVGIIVLRRKDRGSLKGFFLAGRYMWWLPVGASLFASNIGSEHFIGMAGSGAAGGIGVGAFNFNSIILLQLLGWVFIPVFIASGVSTVPQYMSKRFGGTRIQAYLACLSLILYIFTKISVDLYSGALFINQVLKWDLYPSIMALLGLTAAFTMTGGLAAVIYTDTLQFFIMIGGAIFVMVKALDEVGGYTALQYKYMSAVPDLTYPNTTCGVPRKDSWVMLRDPVNSDIPWPAFLFGQTPASIWYWCADQMMVQRVLASKSLSHAQGATIFAAYIKILPFFIIILPGMISRVLYKNDVACVLPEECMRACGSRYSCFNSAYPRLVVGIMPSGLKGIMLAVMLAALMSDLTSIFNSASTMFTLDLWKRLRPNAKTKELLIVGKIFIVLLVAISVAWVPLIESLQDGQLFLYIQRIGAYLAPPIACVYLLAVIWPRMNEKGAFSGLLVGFIIGMIRMVIDFSYKSPTCYEIDTRPAIIAKFNFMYFAALLLFITAIVSVVVSLLTEPPQSYMIIRTTYKTRYDEKVRDDEMLEKISPASAEREQMEIKEAPVEEGRDQQGLCTRVKFSFLWLCGLEATEDETETSEAKDRKTRISSLHQSTAEKIILNANFVLVVLVGIGLFTFFTIDPIPESIRYSVDIGNSTNITIFDGP